MTKTLPPRNATKLYEKEKWGYYGELGEGANAKVRFLQTVIDYKELDDITLISNIEGSEKWDVKNLFQRDVDHDRVKDEIMPYLRNKKKVKFFNPLTLTILPMVKNGKDILKELEYSKDEIEVIDEQDYEVYEKKGFYKFSIIKPDQTFAKIEWNNHNCYIVAIDGQHRLSALKRWKSSPDFSDEELSKWKIPVVILNIYKVNPKITTSSLLEIVRKTFIYINTKAVTVNPARQILLDDESVNAICTQEIVQFSHTNDNKPLTKRDDTVLPLMFFNWRGETSKHKLVRVEAAIKEITEIHDWLEYYILSENNSTKQEKELNLTDMVPPIKTYNKDSTLSYKDSQRIREQFRNTVMPGIIYFLQNFKPDKEYIANCRQIEKEAKEESDVTQHAFIKLRFGTHNAPEDQRPEVDKAYDKIVEKICSLKEKFPETLLRDIGMRGIVFAFSTAKENYENIILKKSIRWLDFAKEVIDIINEIYTEGWFNSLSSLDKKKKGLLTYIVFDDYGIIINYRLKDAEDAFGALLTLLLFHKWRKKNKKIKSDDFCEIWDNHSYNLSKTIEKGYRKYFRAELRDTFKGTKTQFDEEVKKKAAKEKNKRINNLAKYLELDSK